MSKDFWEGYVPEPVKPAPVQPVADAWMHTMIDDVVVGHRPADLNVHPDRWVPLYKDPTPCKTCEALARTVMMDQTAHDTTPPAQPAVPAFNGVATKKLDSLIDRGYQINGLSFEQTEDGGAVTRGAITCGGMVLWWNQTPAAPASWVEMVTANLVREGVNKHKARELAEHFYGLKEKP